VPEATLPPTAVRLAGYQGDASILTAALRRLAQALDTSGWGLPVDFQADVTAAGEKATALFASLEGGARQLGYMASSYLAESVPALGVLDLPFSVSERSAALAALDGEAGALLREAVARDSGLHVLAFWDNGFRHVSNAVRPIRSPADCAGLVIRTLDNALYRAVLGAVGFHAISTDVKELVHAVETGAVQAQENPLTNLITFGLWRHHHHVSLTGHFFGVLLLVCPRAWHEHLAPAQRAALALAVADATALQRRLAAAQDTTALAELRSRGVEVLGPEQIDLPAMRAATEPLAARQRERLPAGLLHAYLPQARH
jgi:TRAP-type C4-dicarboxylate transport system substrate-binding protein